ncbi:MAG: arginine--tRNA ligase [Ignisphaera sp.]|nr:arginine--tRNA ligase [Ignisphaera sp.]MDW8085898.1 arginine--tRNA ligase [Ignisphaera sp.]
MTVNPLEIVRTCVSINISKELNIDPSIVKGAFTVPREEYGDLTIVSSKLLGGDRYINRVVRAVENCDYISRVDVVGMYVNMWFNRPRYTELVLNSVIVNGAEYGVYRDVKKRIVVEYVSANPVHPLHIGAARNAAIGSFIANINRAVGNDVQTRFYINDVGRQVAILVLGIKQLRSAEPPEGIKPDHWIGLVYAITNTIVEALSLRRKLELEGSDERKREIQRELDSLLVDAARLREQAPDIFDAILGGLRGLDIESEISKIMKGYEMGEEEISKQARNAVSLCIEGLNQTLKRFKAEIDVWDWESDLVWSGEVDRIVEELRKASSEYKGTLAVNFKQILEIEGIRDRLRIPRNLEIPPLVLLRSNGTSLYTVRDIAYSIKKFREYNADRVINVIASEQTLPQAQLRLALYTLGYHREAENLVHYSYEIVNVEGTKMSSRRGRIVTLDSVLEEAKVRSLAELEKRGAKSEEMAEIIGVAAVRFYLLSVTPSRPVKFSWDSVLNFERNSAPYLLYTFARTEGVFRKARELGIDLSWSKILEKADLHFAQNNLRRWRLVKMISEYPDVFYRSYTELDPSIMTTYMIRLADEFNSWYNEEPIVLEANESLRNSKLITTYAVNQILRSAFRILGIEALERL